MIKPSLATTSNDAFNTVVARYANTPDWYGMKGGSNEMRNSKTLEDDYVMKEEDQKMTIDYFTTI